MAQTEEHSGNKSELDEAFFANFVETHSEELSCEFLELVKMMRTKAGVAVTTSVFSANILEMIDKHIVETQE